MKLSLLKNKLPLQNTLHHDQWEGAVLFLCNDQHVFFIKRAPTMPTHGGQIGFLGGHRKKDENSPYDVVAREFFEETGVAINQVEILGYLPRVLTSQARPIVPLVGKIDYSSQDFLSLAESNGEWVNCYAYPWLELENEALWNYVHWHGIKKYSVLFYTLSQKNLKSQQPESQSQLLWGATARMVWNLLHLYYKS